MSNKQTNGITPMNSPRPPFRRQGSSVAGGQHPMTVALTPAQRVDYSVTKGGARTWAVLLVFMFLCSSLYTVFSAKELAEIAVDIDGDGSVDFDNELDDDVDEVATQLRHTMKDTTPTKDEQTSHDRRHEKSIPQDEIKTADDDDDAYVDDTLEEKLFAGLRAKIQKIGTIVKNKVRVRDEEVEKEEEEEEARVKVQSRRKRQKQKMEQREDRDEQEKQSQQHREKRRRPVEKVEEIEDENEEETAEDQNEEEKKYKMVRRWNSKKKREEEIRIEIDDDDDDRDDKDSEGTDDDDEGDDEQAENKEEADEKSDKDDDDEKNDGNEDEDDKKDDEDNDDDEESDGEQEEKGGRVLRRDQKPVRRAKTSHLTDTPQRECRRKNCPTDFGITPRMALLKKNKKHKREYHRKHREVPLRKFRVRDEFNDDDELDDDDDDNDEQDDIHRDENENDEEGDENEETVQPTYAEVVAVKKYRSSGREAYKRHAITNKDDHKYRHTLDHADYLVEKHDYDDAIKLFDQILRANPESPRAHFGKARAHDIKAEFSADDQDVDKALDEYEQVIENDETPDALFRQAASRIVERARYRNAMHRALQSQRTLIDRFPEDLKLQVDFGLTFLMMKRQDDARKVFKNILDIDPNNALALAYYGYILKVADDDIEGGVQMMRKGLQRGAELITDAKFYYHLGDGLMTLARPAEAYKVYEMGADIGVFLSPHQRSMYNVEGLKAIPWWTMEQTGYTKHLRAVERQWVAVRHEALNVLEYFPDEWINENEQLTVDGEWKAFRLLHNDEWDQENCELMPRTCAVLKEFRASSNASRSEMKISVLSSGTKVSPHCGSTNARLQAQLGLVVPSEARIRVGHDRKGWKTGRFIIFDDSFEHEFSFDGASSSAFRLVLVLDIWHPEMDYRQRADTIDDID